MQHLLLRYTQSLITQMAQTAVCNRHHSVDQQLCRWLLLSLDRLPTLELVMTQELIANMLGVRREGVTAAAGKLQDAGVIEYRRGRIKVLDRPKLEQLSCEMLRGRAQGVRAAVALPDGEVARRRSGGLEQQVALDRPAVRGAVIGALEAARRLLPVHHRPPSVTYSSRRFSCLR
jgi:hypothetical protein